MFPSWWAERYASCPPLGYMLRARYVGQWLRIHSLEGSKRYADTDAEWAQLLARHDALAREILGDAPCTLVTVTYQPALVGTRLALEGFGARTFACFAAFGTDGVKEVCDLDVPMSFWATDAVWDLGDARDVVVGIAEDALSALWFNRATGEVFAPYDGGVDLILADATRRNALGRRWARWLSAREDGL